VSLIPCWAKSMVFMTSIMVLYEAWESGPGVKKVSTHEVNKELDMKIAFGVSDREAVLAFSEGDFLICGGQSNQKDER
jgi:hypothetical protein